MREITTHRVEGKGGGQDHSRILVLDEPGPGGANHVYVVVSEPTPGYPHLISLPDDSGALTDYNMLGQASFQKGPIQEEGVNGVQQEHLLAIVLDRLESFQRGPYPNDYNAEAIVYVRAALNALKRRTLDRIARQVEGYNQA